MKLRLFVIAATLLITGTYASAMELSFSWGPTIKCFDSKSPPMTVSQVPNGTAKLRFRMVDRNKMSYRHGGGTVDFKGSGNLPYGAFLNSPFRPYKGPCPRRTSPHTYEFTVQAIDMSGRVLAKANARRKFPE